MNNIQKRFLLFLIFCLGSRSLLAYIAYKSKNPIIPIFTLLVAIGWLRIYFITPRDTGPEVFGQKIWWNNFRLVHAFNYILFSVLYILNVEKAWMVLVLDVIIALIAFLHHHYVEGNFKEL